MKLYKALKLKKKVIGEVAKLNSQISSRNSYLVGSLNSEKYNIRGLENELTEKVKYLVSLKCAINNANRGIQDKIYWLSEYKSIIQLWNGLDVTEGMQLSGYPDRVAKEYKVQIDEKERDEKIKNIQNTIDLLQEEVDVYNHTTELSIE